MQRVHMKRLIDKYGTDFEVQYNKVLPPLRVYFGSKVFVFPLFQAMFRDAKLNKMQHSVGVLKQLHKRFVTYENQSFDRD